MHSFIKLSQESIDQQLSADAQSAASGYFEQIRSGKTATPRTPLFRSEQPSEVITNWLTVLDRYALDGKLTSLVDYDKSRESKVGPQGSYPPLDQRMENLLAYWTLPNQQQFVINDETCSKISNDIFGNHRDKRPLTLESVVARDKYDDKLITNSGPPDFAKKNDPAVISNAIRDAKSGAAYSYVVIIGSRSQRGKDRFIFIPAFSLTLLEKSYVYPLMEIIRNKSEPYFSAWEGFEEVELGFKSQNFFDGDLLIQQDYTSMDKYINETHIEIIYRICSPVFQASYRGEFRKLLDHILTVPVMINLDKIITGKHGIPSGSGFTNFVESLISLYISYLYEDHFNVFGVQGLGDDLALSLVDQEATEPNKARIADVLATVSGSIGLVVEPSKQRIDSDTIVYLQRFFDKDIPNSGVVLGMYPSILALNTAMNPERFHDPRKWSGELEILRWIMILENCKNLPYYRDLVQYFIKGDKFKLGLASPDFFSSLPNIYEKSKAIKGFIPSYNQEGLDRGIADFETVKLIQSLG